MCRNRRTWRDCNGAGLMRHEGSVCRLPSWVKQPLVPPGGCWSLKSAWESDDEGSWWFQPRTPEDDDAVGQRKIDVSEPEVPGDSVGAGRRAGEERALPQLRDEGHGSRARPSHPRRRPAHRSRQREPRPKLTCLEAAASQPPLESSGFRFSSFSMSAKASSAEIGSSRSTVGEWDSASTKPGSSSAASRA